MSTAVVILADGFEEIEAVTQIDVLRRAGVAAVACGNLIAGLIALALRRSRPTRFGEIAGPAALEFAFCHEMPPPCESG